MTTTVEYRIGDRVRILPTFCDGSEEVQCVIGMVGAVVRLPNEHLDYHEVELDEDPGDADLRRVLVWPREIELENAITVEQYVELNAYITELLAAS